MKLSSPTGVVFTYLVWCERDDRPRSGDTYRDPLGHQWTIRHVSQQVILGGPETANLTPWSIDLVAEHGAYRIEPETTLIPVRTRKSGLGWDGTVEHLDMVGFGDVVQRLPGPELMYGSNRWSWLYREVGSQWELRVGPHVTYLADFHEHCFERSGENQQPLVEGDRWARIRPALLAFQEGED